jgi:hypothetical protein
VNGSDGDLDGGEQDESIIARFFPVLGEAGLRPNHEKVLSTTQRRGKRTKPFMSSLRLTISMRNNGTFASAVST